MKMKGADIIADYLVKEKVPYTVGLCGHGNIGLMDAFYERSDKIKLISVRHEQAAGYIADAYFRVKHEPIATFTSCGPSSTNMVTPIAAASIDCSAFLAITGNVSTTQFNRSPFQESGKHNQADFPSVLRPYVKKSFQATRVDQLPLMVRQSFKECTNGKPGPVNLDVPFNVFQEEDDVEIADPARYNWGMKPRAVGDLSALSEALELLAAAQKPLIVCGQGTLLSEAAKEVLEFATFMNIPIHTSPNGKSSIDETNPLSLGATGRNGTWAANSAGKNCDVLLALGTSFDDRATSAWLEGFTYTMNQTKLIHIDIDAREIGRNYPFTLGIVGDIKATVAQLIKMAGEKFANGKPCYDEWWSQIKEWKQVWNDYNAPLLASDADPIRPERIIRDIRKVFPKNGILLPDVGVHHNWVVQFWDTYEPRTILQTWGFAAMGFGTCGVLGAKLAAPERPALTICGDGSFMMCPHILATAVEYNLPAIWVIWNNFAYGAIRDQQQGFFKGHEIGTSFVREQTGELFNPDFVKLAESFGVQATKVTKADQLAPAVEHALKLNQPYLIDVIVDRDIKPVGTGNWVLDPFKPGNINFKPGLK